MQTKDYREEYNKYLLEIEEFLSEYTIPQEPFSLYEPFHYIITGGGKRIRPVLTMLCCGAAGGNPENALRPAAAIEILHNFTLVHDDIMDKSPLRRGRQTVHQKWNEATAILTGDVMVGSAYNLLPTSKEHQRSDEIKQAFTRGLIEVCEGQAYDTQFDAMETVSISDYIMMIEKKTARLLETCALVGGHCGYADEKTLLALKDFANALGLGFQVQDDLLDLTADQTKFGKKVGQDIIEGKKTFLIIKALETITSGVGKDLLNQFIENKGLSEEYVPAFRNLFEQFGILNSAQEQIEFYFDKALNSLDFIADSYHKEMLIWLLNSLNKRVY